MSDSHETDRRHMRHALALARQGWGMTAPNPMVGAVVARGPDVLGTGYHARYGDAHAESVALDAAGDGARGATLYVTLEPCTHQGKRGPCTASVIATGVARVVIAVRDPNPVAAGGVEQLRAAGIATEVGLDEREARELNAAFFHAIASDRPWTTLKLATSLDGAISDANRSPGWLTGADARREVHRMRAGSDAVAIGLGTALADDPLLTVRDAPAPRVPTTRIIFDRGARLPLQSRLVRTAADAPVIVVAESPDDRRRGLLEAAGVIVIDASGPAEALRELRTRGILSLLVEGGARLAGAMLAHDLVDRLVIFQAPVLLGAGALGAFSCAPSWRLDEARRPELIERRQVGEDQMAIYAMG